MLRWSAFFIENYYQTMKSFLIANQCKCCVARVINFFDSLISNSKSIRPPLHNIGKDPICYSSLFDYWCSNFCVYLFIRLLGLMRRTVSRRWVKIFIFFFGSIKIYKLSIWKEAYQKLYNWEKFQITNGLWVFYLKRNWPVSPEVSPNNYIV